MSGTAGPPSPFTVAAIRADRRVLRAAHPVTYPLVRALDRLGPAACLPGLGVVVNDPGLVRAVLVDAERFRKDGPASTGALWTPVVGRRALINLDGPEHRQLRAALAGRFGPDAVAPAVAEAAAPVLARLGGRLADGEAVDVVPAARELAGAAICRLLEIDLTPEEAAELTRRCERLTAGVRLHTRRLSTGRAAAARAVLGPVADAAAAGSALGLGADDARSVAAVLFLTGTETVMSFLPRLVALLAASGLLAPGTVATTVRSHDRLVAEALRLTAPTPVTLRQAVAPARLGPVRVREGERIVVLTVNALWSVRPRDRDVGELRQLWFGAGPHFCLGRPLALAEADALVSALSAAVGRSGRAVEVASRRAARGVLIPAWRELTIRLVRVDAR